MANTDKADCSLEMNTVLASKCSGKVAMENKICTVQYQICSIFELFLNCVE